jgi:AcrR family transcriptional regulator
LARESRTRAPRLPAEERRQQILDVAIDVFARLGYHGAGTADIAAAAAIGEPTIYRYFASKGDLYLQAVGQCGDRILENWSRIVDSSENALQAIRGIGTWYYEESRRHPELLVLRFRTFTESSDPELMRIVREGYMRIVRLVEGLYERARMEGSLRQDADTSALAWLFMAMGSIIDQTYLLGLGDDEFGPRQLEGIRRIWEASALVHLTGPS